MLTQVGDRTFVYSHFKDVKLYKSIEIQTLTVQNPSRSQIHRCPYPYYSIHWNQKKEAWFQDLQTYSKRKHVA